MLRKDSCSLSLCLSLHCCLCDDKRSTDRACMFHFQKHFDISECLTVELDKYSGCRGHVNVVVLVLTSSTVVFSCTLFQCKVLIMHNWPFQRVMLHYIYYQFGLLLLLMHTCAIKHLIQVEQIVITLYCCIASSLTMHHVL